MAAEKIENVLQESPLIMQAFVYGDSLKVRRDGKEGGEVGGLQGRANGAHRGRRGRGGLTITLCWTQQSELVGIIVPDAESTAEWAKEQGMGDLSFAELCRQPLLK